MSAFHRYVAYAIPAGFALLALWTLYCFVRNRAPRDAFWNVLAVVQVVFGIQVLVGGFLFLMGLRPTPNGPVWLHYVYGGLFPAALLIAAHRVAARDPGEATGLQRFLHEHPWVVFGAASLVNFGLTFRALQTGLGID